MGPRTARHLIDAGIGVAAAPAVAFLVLDGIRGTVFLALQLQSSHVSQGLPPGTGIRVPAHGPWLATLEFATAAAITGVLAGAKRISPVAPLVAALLLLAIHFYGHSSVGAFLEISRHAPADLMIAVQDAIISDVFLLLGGALVVAALAPWRWRTSELPPPWANWHAAGVLAGMAAVPLLWLILQLSEGASSPIGITGVRIFADEFLLFMLAGVVALGVLASARWVSPVAAVRCRPVHACGSRAGTGRDRPTRVRPDLATRHREPSGVRVARAVRRNAAGSRSHARPMAAGAPPRPRRASANGRTRIRTATEPRAVAR